MRINRTGETNNNNFGSEMTIIRYKNKEDIDIYFSDYDWTFEHAKYINFKNGKIKCPYEPRYRNKGYLGERQYKSSIKGKSTKSFQTWNGMLERCYDIKYQTKQPTYVDCTVCDEWLNFQNFAKWYDNNYYHIDGEKMCLDKDILIKNNKIYSPDTCIIVPESINLLFVKANNLRGEYPIGVYYNSKNNKLIARCDIRGKKIHLGCFELNQIEEAFLAYKTFKENHIKRIADEYKDLIPERLYNAMYEYEVEITD